MRENPGDSGADAPALRSEHSMTPRVAKLPPDPIEQFTVWLRQAQAAGVHEPNAMTLATTSHDGQPSARIVLLKQFDPRGFVFFTNLDSRKAREIAANPRVALVFAWPPMKRQVIVTGTTERISVGETLRYFLTRPRGSQIAAWISNQSRVISSRTFLEMQWRRMARKFAEGRIPVPPFWGGYRVTPHQIEFWQGQADHLHDRFRYTRDSDERWRVERLAP